MKHFLPALLVLASALPVAAEVQVTILPEGETAPAPAPARIMSTADVLCEEDFSNFTEGTEDEPEFGVMIANNGSTIEDFRTSSPGWLGHKVFEAGGCCALQTYDPYNQAYITTPAGDYSGSVRVTFRAKYLITEWENEDGSKHRWTGSTIRVALDNESKRTFETSEGTNDLASLRLYLDQGWCEVTVDFDNYSAFNDAHIVFSTDDSVLIDNIKITSSVDNFIASPNILAVRDITETSFTIDFEPVRKAYNYYIMLYTCEGTDPETGEPIYIPVLDKDSMAYLEQLGITVKEYLQQAGMSPDDPYLMLSIVQAHEPKTFTYTDLNPEQEYYFAVRSHYLTTFSEPRIQPLPNLPTPIPTEAESITDNSFLARWNPIVKADNYDVNLYGVQTAPEDTKDFIVFEESFDKTSLFTDCTDLWDPYIADENTTGITVADLVTNPGWTTDDYMGLGFYGLLNKGMVCFTDPVTTPAFFCGSGDEIYVHLTMVAPDPEFRFTLTFAGQKYTVNVEEEIYDDYIMLPTNGLKEGRLTITAGGMNPVYIDEIAIGVDVKKGDMACTLLQQVNNITECEYTFAGLDKSLYDMYAYGVSAVRSEDGKRSVESERMLVDLNSGTSVTSVGTGIDESLSTDKIEVARYALDGTKLDAPVKGINIIRYSDGSTRKVIVR
ncbi:MAG: hypothetical protein K2H47_09710 [Muribaculaceae bacterium]|nr:hypothetical protein [Muribaculaceae bacterium]